MSVTPQAPLLEVRNLQVRYPGAQGGSIAVHDVSLTLPARQILALVGESGCGKSTTTRALLQLLRPDAGQVYFRGNELTQLWRRRFGRWTWGPELRQLRQHMQLIFQDPLACLNPRMTVFELIAEPLRAFDVARGPELRDRVQALLLQVGLDPQVLGRYPHAFSGGQRQRLGIARALALSPHLLVADEPISALDVSIQAQILNLLAELQESLGLTYLLVAHDLAVVRHFSDDVAVMYRGRIVETGPTAAVFAAPAHPYTQALLAAVPGQGTPPPVAVPWVDAAAQGCPYLSRCPARLPRCSQAPPPRVQLGGGQAATCHRLDDARATTST